MMLETGTTPILKAYFETALTDRRQLLLDYLSESRNDVHMVWDILDIYSADPGMFISAVESALQDDPGNLLSIRALAWLNARQGKFAEAQSNLLSLIDQLPSAVVERRELLRVGFVAPQLLTETILNIGGVGLDSPVSKASYRYQTSRAQGSATMSTDAEKLVAVLKAAGEEIKSLARNSNDPNPMGALHSPISWMQSRGRVGSR